MNEGECVKLNYKKKLSQTASKSLAKGYQEFVDEDLAIAKDFEQIEDELNKKCDE